MRRTSRFRLSSLVLFLLTGSAAEIPQGAHVLLRMVNSVSTRTAQPGDTVYMQTASPIAAASMTGFGATSPLAAVAAKDRNPRAP